MTDFLAGVRVHPAAELFPLLQGRDFDAFVEDIREHGLREPVVFTADGQLLDGRNRYRACKKLGDEPPHRVEHSEDPWAYVVSINMCRRHLDASQLAMIGAEMGVLRGAFRGNQHVGRSVSMDTEQLPPTKEEAAALLGVSTGSIGRARRVLEHGTPELVAAVKNRDVSVRKADEVAAEYDEEGQEAFLLEVAAGVDPRMVKVDSERKRSTPVKKLENSTDRRRKISYLDENVLRYLLETFSAVTVVFKDAEGLDPAITPTQAARWVSDLGRASASYRSIVARLKQHSSKEELTSEVA